MRGFVRAAAAPVPRVGRSLRSILMQISGVACAVALAPSPVPAQTPRLRMEVDTAVVTVGDPIMLAISVDHAPDLRVAWPDSLDLEPFEVLDARLLPSAPTGEEVTSTAVLTLAAFELGELEIPSFDLEILTPEGEATTLSTNRFGIQVLSVGLDEGGDIREIRGPVGIPLNPLGIVLLLLAAVLAFVLLWALFRRVRKRPGKPEPPRPGPPSRPPHEVALEAIGELERSNLLDRGQVKEYHIRLSDILRVYVEGRFRVSALEMTTLDITSGLARSGLEPWALDGFGDFLSRCDMVKFAKNRPETEESRKVLGLGRELVEGTIPAPPRPELPSSPISSPTETEEARV